MQIPRPPTLILLVGASGVGKDTTAHIIRDFYSDTEYEVMAYHHMEPVYSLADEILSLFPAPDSLGDMMLDYSNQAVKDTRLSPDRAPTVRDLLIDLSTMLRRNFGNDVLGRLAAEVLINERPDSMICLSCRLVDDIERLIEHVAARDILILRITRDDAPVIGNEIDDITPEYLSTLSPAIRVIHLENNRTIEALTLAVHSILSQ